MIVCPNCGKENQDHYKFCLACGTKLPPKGASMLEVPPSAAKPPRVSPPVVQPPTIPTPRQPAGRATPPKPQPVAPPKPKPVTPKPIAPKPKPVPAPPPVGLNIPSIAKPKPEASLSATMLPDGSGSSGKAPAPDPEAPVTCGSCGQVNPPGFRFCGRCGARLTPAPADSMTGPVASSGGATTSAPAKPTPAPAPTPAPPKPKPKPRVSYKARMVLLREDGSEGGSLDIEGGPHTFGRQYGPPFDQDYYLNPEHCAFTVREKGLFIEDLHKLNGVYRKIEGRCELQDKDMFRVGQELLYYEDLPEPTPNELGTERMGSPNPGYWGRVCIMIDGTHAVEGHPIADEQFHIGREQGDLTFPMDGYVSSSHCRIYGDDTGVYLEDLGSSNGTYLRIRTGTIVPFGALILVGQQLFRIDRI